MRCRAEEGVVYEGVYGNWSIDEKDKREVFLYRLGLSVSAASFAVGTAVSFLPEQLTTTLYDPLCILGVMGFGVSLTQVHMYAAPIKRAIQGMWLLGVVGALYLATTQDASVPVSVVQNPGYVWLVGPFFAAMTGLAIKEGLCYGKAEAALLTLLIPATLLGHLSHTLPLDVLHFAVTTCAVLFGVLAMRKYTQPIKDDIGDKSIFTFLSLSESEQNEILERMNV